jgi:hypothetical protein
LKRNIENLSAIQEKSGYLLRQRATSGLSASRKLAANEVPSETGRYGVWFGVCERGFIAKICFKD